LFLLDKRDCKWDSDHERNFSERAAADVIRQTALHTLLGNWAKPHFGGDVSNAFPFNRCRRADTVCVQTIRIACNCLPKPQEIERFGRERAANAKLAKATTKTSVSDCAWSNGRMNCRRK